MRRKPAILLVYWPKNFAHRRQIFVFGGLRFLRLAANQIHFETEVFQRWKSFLWCYSTLFVVCHQHITMASVRPCITNDSLRQGKCAVPVHQYPSKRACGFRICHDGAGYQLRIHGCHGADRDSVLQERLH